MNLELDERLGLPSASKIESYFLCPGKYLAEKDLPEEPTSEYATKGNRVHAALALGDVAGLSDDEREIYLACSSQAYGLVDQWSSAYATAEVKIFKEERLWLHDERMKPICSGKYDLMPIAGNRAAIIDYKSGWSDTAESAKNEQLRTLAVLVFENYGCEEITVAIVQPKVSSKPDICLYEKKDLELSQERLVKHLDYISKPGAPRIPGKVQCDNCKAKANCYAAKDQVTILANFEPKQVVDPEEIAKWLDVWAVAKKVGPALEQQALKLALAGTVIPGYEAKEGVTRRTITDATVAFSKLQDKIDAATFAGCCTVKISDLETAFRKATGLKTKESKQAFNELLADVIEMKQSAPNLVKAEAMV